MTFRELKEQLDSLNNTQLDCIVFVEDLEMVNHELSIDFIEAFEEDEKPIPVFLYADKLLEYKNQR